MAEFARVTGNAHEVWAKARANKDFASFQPVLERIIDLRRQYAGFFAPTITSMIRCWTSSSRA